MTRGVLRVLGHRALAWPLLFRYLLIPLPTRTRPRLTGGVGAKWGGIYT